jgi:inactive STAND/Trypsin-like peptidase domain
MIVTNFFPPYAVEILGSEYGSGYRIGGRLVLTAAHLFESLGSCQVRSKKKGNSDKGFFELVEAQVVWIADGVDVALVELPESIEPCDPVQFGLLSDGSEGESIDFQFYGYPKSASTEIDHDSSVSGGQQVNGEICPADSLYKGLVRLRPKSPTVFSTSDWKGASGAAIVCDGCVVAVQSQQQNPQIPDSLAAEPLSKVYTCSDWHDRLEKHGITQKPKSIKLPKSKAKRSTSSKTDTAKPSRRLTKDNAADLFWHLDYKKQERDFEDRLDELKSCDAFSVVAPCEMTQRWLLNRLMKKIPNLETPMMIRPINLSKHPMQHNFDEFWMDLAQQIGAKPQKDEVLRSLCHSQVECPVILTIYGFRECGPTQKKIIREFWEPLTGMMNRGSKRSSRSRIVLFLVDQCRPNYDSASIVALDPFDELPPKDVKIWFESDAVTKWCKKQKLGNRSADHWIEHEVPQGEWENPSLIFDRLYGKLSGQDEIKLEDVWKWAS